VLTRSTASQSRADKVCSNLPPASAGGFFCASGFAWHFSVRCLLFKPFCPNVLSPNSGRKAAMTKTMTIGILETGRPPDAVKQTHGDYPQAFETLLAGNDFDFKTWDCLNGNFPDNINAADGWLVTGSRSSVYEDLPWITPLENFVRDAYNNSVPLVGICFGHQLIAQALGGKVERYKDGWNVGKKEYSAINSNETFSLNAIHQDQVVEKPADATLIASSESCANAVLAYGNKALTIQAHPEFNKSFTIELLESMGTKLPADALTKAKDSLSQTDAEDRGKTAEQIASFFRAAHKQSST